jgi:hypothetical protein
MAGKRYCSWRCRGMAANLVDLLPAMLGFDRDWQHGPQPLTRAQALQHPDVSALLLRAVEKAPLRLLPYHGTPCAPYAWAMAEYPTAAFTRTPAPPLRARPGVAEPPLACVFTAESDVLLNLGDEQGPVCVACVRRLDEDHAVYAFLGAADVNVYWPQHHVRFLGYQHWAAFVAGAPTDSGRLRQYAHDLGRALAQLHFQWLCDGTSMAVVLAAPRGAPPTDPPRLYVMVDTALCGDVPPQMGDDDDDDVVGTLADNLARMAYVPAPDEGEVVRTSTSTTDTLFAHFSRGYLTEARSQPEPRDALAQRVLTAMKPRV